MHKTFLLALTLLASIGWIQAQDQTPQAAQPASGQSSAGQTVEGCLQGSNGTFTLTDASGTTYQLQGDTAKLTEHVGHEVQITGSNSGAASPSPSSTATPSSSGANQQTLTVEKVKHVSKTCKSAK
jgi:uncharacterized protein involved in copper resistance